MVDARGEANPGLVVLVVILILALIAAFFFWPRGGEEAEPDVNIEVGAAPGWIVHA